MAITPAIILIIVAAVAGYFVGIFDSRLTQAAQKKLAEVSKPAEDKPVDEEPRDAGIAGEHTVLKVTVDPAIKWHLELDGARLEDPTAVSGEQRQRLINTVMQIRPWIDGKAATAPASAPGPVSEPGLPSQLVPEPAPAAPVAASTVLPVSVPEEPPKVDFMRGLRSLLKNEVKTPDQMKGLSIVAMIDEVLQAKLSGTPLCAKRIRLEEGPLGEVIVYVGASRYSGVEAVPDPEIQGLIKSAIADWEKK